MRLKPLSIGKYEVVAVMDGAECPALKFILEGESSTLASRNGLLTMLNELSLNGFENIPSSWHHEANKKEGIHEFIKGKLRLFYFKGANNQIAVCTGGVMKSGQKADSAAVAKAAKMHKEYFKALEEGELILETDENEDQ